MAKSSSSVQTVETNISLTNEQERCCIELEKTADGKELSKQFKNGKVDSKTFRVTYEITQDPNKISKNDYQLFVKAVSTGKFANRLENAVAFLDLLIEGTDEQKSLARRFLRKITSTTESKISQRKEKEVLKRIREAKEHIPIPSEVEDSLSKITREIKTLDVSTGKNWEIEAAPPELVEDIENIDRKITNLANEYNKIDTELRELEIEGKEKGRIEVLKKRLREIDEEIAKLDREKEKFINYLHKNLLRYRAIKDFSQKSGIDINSIKKILVSSFTLLSKEEAKAKGLKLQGIYVDPRTGEAKKQLVTYEIKSIYFEDEDDANLSSPGKMLIEYVDDKGKRTVSNPSNFLSLLNALEAHEAIDSLDVLNKSIQENSHYTGIALGQEFETEQRCLDENNEIVQEKQSFKIKLINDREQKIILDREIIKTPRNKLNKSVYDSLYFDRKQKEFSYGEFSKLLKQQSFKRVLTEQDDLQEIIDKQEEAYESEMEDLMELSTEDQKTLFEAIGGVEKYKLTVPGSGQKQAVIFKDESGNRREGFLSCEEDNNGERSYYLNEADQITDLDTLMTTVPMSMAAAPVAKTSKQLFQKRKLDKRSLMAMTNGGDINNQEEATQEPAQGEPAQGEPAQEGPEQGEPAQEEPAQEEPAQEEPAQEETTEEELPEEEEEEELEPPTPKDLQEKLDIKAKKEALPYSAINKFGDMQKTERGFLKSLWANTRVITFNDLWEMGKTMYEFYIRRFERRQKERYSSLGEDLPFFGPEMKRINQQAENEEVNQFKDFLEQSDIFDVQKRLQKTGNRDEMKAAFMVLVDKGQIRWDDIDMWKCLNKFVHHSFAIPIPTNGDPHTKVSESDPRTGMDFLRGAVDSLWGSGTYNDWFNRNNSTFGNKIKDYYNEGSELEAIEGGHARRLATLLAAHKRGEFVDPHEYEGLITHAIEFGKSTMYSKIYYIIEGIAAFNSQGRTILAFERLGTINSNNLTRFPLLEYFTASHMREDGQSHKYTIEDFKKFVHEFDGGDPMNPGRCEPNEKVSQFLWEKVLVSNDTHNRIRKVARNMEQVDHDDMFAYMPPLDEDAITDVCQAATGRKKYLTIEGYANVFPGFNQYIRTLGKIQDKDKLAEAIISYVRFESIITDKFEKHKGNLYQRLNEQILNKGTIVTPDVPPQAFINQLNEMINKIAIEYAGTKYGQELMQIADTIYNLYVEDPEYSPSDMDKQKKVDHALRKFGKIFKKVVKEDNGKKMIKIVNSFNLQGMPFSSDAMKDRRKAQFADTGFE